MLTLCASTFQHFWTFKPLNALKVRVKSGHTLSVPDPELGVGLSYK